MLPVDLSKVNLFVEALIYGLLEYNAYRTLWMVRVGDEQILGEVLMDKFQRQCAHYYGYKDLILLDSSKLVKIEIECGEKRRSKGLLNNDRRKLIQALSDYRNAREGTEKPWSENSPFADDGNEASWPMASKRFVMRADMEAYSIRRFYDAIIEQLYYSVRNDIE